jgi:hypothetical protein
MSAFYEKSVSGFLQDDLDHILGKLTARAGEAGFYQQLHSQTAAWQVQLDLLRSTLLELNEELASRSWHILLEYPIPRRGKRIDAVLLLPGCIVVLEFKCGSQAYDSTAMMQLEDYCLDLADFHRESAGRVIVPILVATHADSIMESPEGRPDQIKSVLKANRHDLGSKLSLCEARYGHSDAGVRDPRRWDKSDYSPTPTIIEAAQSLYAGNNVLEISRCHADNLTTTTDAVLRFIEQARAQNTKTICFITGVAGAGKTLAGLNVVHNHGLHDQDLGVFLSGNGPLVRVLSEALARDHRHRTRSTLKESHRKVGTFIQNVHRFIDAYFAEPTKVPVDRVAVFDEAQRAWNAEQSLRKFKRDFSEPEIMLEVMDRHEGWAVIVALVGVGQEINQGEAGLSEWGRALEKRFPHWTIAVSPELSVGKTRESGALFQITAPRNSLVEEPALHLSVTLRSYKAQKLSEFVESVLDLDADGASRLMDELQDYPIVITRSLDTARRWLKQHQRGTRRIGLVASSGDRRLLAHGLDVTADLDVENWFLNPSLDARSSFYLEVPATEFGIQGLELDWVGLCWGADVTPEGGSWLCRKFRGTSWQQVRNPQNRQYAINKYRVLLTRAREGLVIWVPPGDPNDLTRPPVFYDRIATFLQLCGIPLLRN